MSEKPSPLPDEFSLTKNCVKGAANLLHAEASAVYLKQDDRVVMRAAYGYSETLVDHAQYLL